MNPRVTLSLALKVKHAIVLLKLIIYFNICMFLLIIISVEFPKYLSRTFKAKLHEVFGEIEEEEKKASIVKCKAKRPPHRISNKSLTSRHS